MRVHRHVMLVTLFSAVAVVMSAASGCEDDKTPASSGGPEPTDSDFISRYVKALCDRTFACCDAAARAARGLDAGSAEACASDLHAIFIAIGGGGEVKGIFVPEKAEACLAEVGAAPCAELEILGALLGVDEKFTPSCIDAWDGSVPEGEACGTNWDCARDRCVRNVDSSGQSTSACKAKGAAGEPCSATFDCEEALRCDTGTCAPRLAVGGSCKGSVDCQKELRCAQDDTCQAREQAGGPCASDEDCAAGTTCKGSMCAPLGTVGAPCSSDSDCASSACVDATSTCADVCKGG
ncbi:hypothetical protein [Polyangium sorediatum]|uniref:Dickkopf N-terminal cysteine-rich domain-containing protein n=1 Tax=Polyangium sorediatum TaxID=889274 RepID=A0ABT6P1F7_9BACT|nr:hypothetical protein [Polyangium sorediatum]MDI1434413.1 hypothetical protein [Polyangium sorediatum]